MIRQILTISQNTLTESIRQPIFVVLVLTFTIVLVFIPSLSQYSMDDDNHLLVHMGLSTLAIAGLLLAAFSATGVLSAEVENKTVLTVVSKPVSRPAFVLGKFVGVAGAVGLGFWALMMVFLLTVRHKVMQTASDPFDVPVITFGSVAFLAALMGATLANYLYRTVFTSTFVVWYAVLLSLAVALVLVVGKGWKFQSIATEFSRDGALQAGQLPIVLLMIFETLLIITAVAIAASTRLGQVMTLVVTVGVAVLGLLSKSLLLDHVERSASVAAIYRVIPNFQFLWTADALVQAIDISGSYVLWVSVYSLLFVAATLFLAVALFQSREVG